MWVHQQCFYHSVTSQSMVRLRCIYSEQFQFKKQTKTAWYHTTSDTFPLKSLWQRKINHDIKKKKIKTTFCKLLWKQTNEQTNKTGMRKSPQIWSVDGRMAQRCNKVRNFWHQRVMVVHAYSTGLHCTTWSNHWKIFYHAQNANDVELPKNKFWQSMQRWLQALTSNRIQIYKSFDP